MANKTAYKTTFELERVIRPLHTGGSVSLSQNGRILVTCLGEDALLTDITTDRELGRIDGNENDLISTLKMTPCGSHLIICYGKSFSMRIYALEQESTSPPSIRAELLRAIKPYSSPVALLAIDKTSTLVATGAAEGVVKVYDIRGGYVTHAFTVSTVRTSALHFFELAPHPKGEETGISARNRKKGRSQSHGEQDDEAQAGRGLRLASGNEEGKIRIWNLYKKSDKPTALDSHTSTITGLEYSPEKNSLLTASRDETLMWWDATTWKARKTVSALEQIEIAGFINHGRYVYIGGVNGCIRIWSTETGREITKTQEAGSEETIIRNVIYSPELPFILSVHNDHSFILHSTKALMGEEEPTKVDALAHIRRISGDHDSIIDLGYVLPDQSLMALATNSESLRIVSLSTTPPEDDPAMGIGRSAPPPQFGADVALLSGHDEIIICISIDWSGHWIATGAKDNTAKLWRIDAANSSFECYATFVGHAEALGAISLSRAAPPTSSAAYKNPLSHPPKFLLTGSKDLTVKRWEVSRGKASIPRALYTRKAHDKDINAIDVNHNDVLFASASQDKLVKIWSVEEGEVIGVLRGHRRGVWSVKFAPKDTPVIIGENGPTSTGKGMILTGSGDKTIKIWSLSNYSCLRTFEGHTGAVLKVAWLNLPKPEDRGGKHVKFVTAGGDALVKVWDANTGELECTLDNHMDKVWSLAVHPTTNTIVSGSHDSIITFWKDTTSITHSTSVAKATEFVEQEQQLQNYIRAGSYRSAITLALQLNHPARLLSLFTSVTTSASAEQNSLSGLVAVDQVLGNLSDEQLYTLLLRVRDWNANARTAPVAQRILWTIVKSYPVSRLANLQVGGRKLAELKDVLNALKAYTERHYRRMEELGDESYLLEYTLGAMDEGVSGSFMEYTEQQYERKGELVDEGHLVEDTLREMDGVRGSLIGDMEKMVDRYDRDVIMT